MLRPLTRVSLVLALASIVSSAQAQESPPPTDAPTETSAPKLAVVVVGDPDPELQAAAQRVERAVAGQLRAPFDPGLRAALRGGPGERDDGLEEVRRERRRLGLDEARDATVLASLGRRAGARAVAAVRAGTNGPEVTVLDVEAAAFYEGSLVLSASIADEAVARFVVRRARVAQRGAAPPEAPSAQAETPALPAPTLPSADTPPALPTDTPPARQPDFFEQFWPYLVAGLLLAGMITAIALTSTGPSTTEQPALRFVPPIP